MENCFRCVAIATLSAWVIACGEAPSDPPPEPADLESLWIRTYEPSRAANGYTLTLWQRQTPVLLDMQGRIVHRWDDVRMKSRVRLLPGGRILGLGRGRSVVEADWDGEIVWSYRVSGAFPHHDVIRLENGNTLVVLKVEGDPGDVLEEVTPQGKVVWRWTALDHLDGMLPEKVKEGDVTHINSVQELPENPWYAEGDGRFRPGNILVSARNLDLVLIVERGTGAVLWSYTGDLDHQHEALMNPPGSARPGRIQILNNRYRSFGADRASEIVEIDPRSKETMWRFRTPGFFTSTGGTQQLLGNGNLLVTSTRGRRVFEIDRDGTVVWEWTPTFQPVRARRYPVDFDPRLRALPRYRLRTVRPVPDVPYLDPETYRFVRRGARRPRTLDGVERVVLVRRRECRVLLIPEQAELQVAWGADRARWRALAAEQAPRALDFVATVERLGSLAGAAAGPEEAQELLRDRVLRSEVRNADGIGALWRTAEVDLSDDGSQRVRICVEVGGDREEWAERIGFWQQPVVVGPSAPEIGVAAELEAGIGAEEEQVRREHLRTMGYVD